MLNMWKIFQIVALILFTSADHEINKSNCSDCICQYQRSFLELENIFSQDSFRIEWYYYVNSFDLSDTLDVFDQWINRNESEISDEDKFNFEKANFRVDTIFFTYETPLLSYPYNYGLENAIIMLKEEDSVYYAPNKSYIAKIQDVFTTKNCSYNYSITDFDSLPNPLYCEANCLGINIFVTRVYTNTKTDVVSIGIAFSDLSDFNQSYSYTSGNILYATLYMDKFQQKTNVIYSQSIGLKPLGLDTILTN